MSTKKALNKEVIQKNKVLDPIWAILFLASFLRVISINQSLWLDEATTALVSKMQFGEILTQFSTKDFHPPLYYFLMKLTGIILGYSEIALRTPSVVAGVLTVFVVYILGKKLFNKQIGMVAALLLATSPLHIYYSQEARMYSLAALIVSCIVYFWHLAMVEKSTKWWVLFSIAVSVVVAVDYLAGIIVLPLLFLTLKNKRSLKLFLLSLIPLATLLLLYLPILSSQISSAIGVNNDASGWWQILGVTNIKNIALVPVKFLIGRIGFSSQLLYGLVVVSFGSLVAFLIYRSKGTKNVNIPFYWLVVPTVLLAFVGLFVPVFVYFRLLFCLPAMYLLCSVGLFKVKEDLFLPLVSVFLIGNLVCSYIYFTNPRFQREDWKALTSTISEESRDKSAVAVFVQNSQMEAYRYYNPSVPVTSADEFNGGVEKVWLMRYVQDVFDPQDTVRTKIENLGYSKEKEWNFNGIVVWQYNLNN